MFSHKRVRMKSRWQLERTQTFFANSAKNTKKGDIIPDFMKPLLPEILQLLAIYDKIICDKKLCLRHFPVTI